MPVGKRLVPNTIGKDIACGLYAVNMGTDLPFGDENFDRLFDATVRYEVPFGYRSHDSPPMHIVDDFDYEACRHNLETFDDNWPHADLTEGFEYDGEYFKELSSERGPGITKAVNQLGSNGGGNHFVEVGIGENSGEYWMIVHSGSRALGAAVADHWQDEATRLRNDEDLDPVETDDLPQEVRDLDVRAPDVTTKDNIDMDKVCNVIPKVCEGEAIEANINRLRQIQHDRESSLESNRNTDLDYLEGEEAVGYIRDMIFCEQYARTSRELMAELVIGQFDRIEPITDFHSTHNYIDFQDGVIRKGACKAEDTPVVVPFNMADGAIIGKGIANDEHNHSAPHGAGRKMSRTQAQNEISMDEYEESMEHIYSSSVNEQTLDEARGAYKDASSIEWAMKGEMVEIEQKLHPVLNCKDDSVYY
jgi:RNA-splicing ligase RtcB